MSIWIKVLRCGAEGTPEKARALLNDELIPGLRRVSTAADGNQRYEGPVPAAVRAFISRLPVSERSMAKAVEDELVDYVMDVAVNEVVRTLVLVELCNLDPGRPVDRLTAEIPWAPGLKKGENWKRKKVMDWLRSMPEAGVPIPPEIMESVSDEGRPGYLFNERAYATSSLCLKRCWKDFKRKQGMGDKQRFFCLVESEKDDGVSAEFFDQCSIHMDEVVRELMPGLDLETLTDLRLLGRVLSPGLSELMEKMHAEAPRDGYRPIAWHNVFWDLSDKYELLALTLEKRNPFLERDGRLVSHISENYEGLGGSSISFIQKRRKRLYKSCEEKIHAEVRVLITR